ncbi:acyl carrier protein [Actinoallomurus rhizosphaericola]|uniref:acyl carrier protein n=1 Tax=Actinoallomurus rhizosphaericola TaxID=2952536 RepID=UPI00209369AF|nr:acyl carrier protein [Actinoallomurus rhizosphaericola]MCO5994848.1 phosphopantetheine-binding protein [Actinoallomurus rhizosphaericola]
MPSETLIRDWLIERVAEYLERSPADIDPSAMLAEYGMDSVYAISLCGDIEAEYDLDVEPTLAWTHPTIHAIAAHLGERVGDRVPPDQPTPTDLLRSPDQPTPTDLLRSPDQPTPTDLLRSPDQPTPTDLPALPDRPTPA